MGEPKCDGCFLCAPQVVQEFRDGKTKILISTDILARGFDHSTISLVINFDMPVEHSSGKPAFETYLHRIGRSGRFGRIMGAAFNLVCGASEARILDAIAEHFQHPIAAIPCNDEDAFEAVLREGGLCS